MHRRCYPRDDLLVNHLRPTKHLSPAHHLLPQQLPPPLQVDPSPTLPVKRHSIESSSTSSQESPDPPSPPARLARREDRNVNTAAAQGRPTTCVAPPSLSERISRRENVRNRALLAKRLRGASAAHSGSTGSLVDLAARSIVESGCDPANDPAQLMARTHRRRASESSNFFNGHRQKRPPAEQYIQLPSTNASLPKKKARPLALTDFSLNKTLGSGGTATVVRAQPIPGSYAASVIPAEEIALKAVAKEGMNRRALRYLNREIHVHRHVQSHSHVASLYEVFQDSYAVYLAMEYLRGSDLYNALKRERQGLSEKVALTIIEQVLDALNHMHSFGYAHRDIKPENIMFAEKPSFSEGRVPDVKLVDFGLACVRNPKAPEKDRHSSEKCGTLRYAAPEIVTETSYIPELCDIWSVGIVLYSIIAHRNPYTGKTEKEVLYQIQHTPLSFEGHEWNRVTEDTKTFIRACLRQKATDRPNAAKALEEVRRVLGILSRSPRSPTRGHANGHRKGDVSGFSSHVTPERGSPNRRTDTAAHGDDGSTPPRNSSDDGNGQPANFLDGLIKAFFSGGSSPDRSRSDNSN